MATKSTNKKKVADPKPSALLAQGLDLLGKNGENWIKHSFEVQAGDIYYEGKKEVVSDHDSYCAIGVMQHIDTPNEAEACGYLVRAVLGKKAFAKALESAGADAEYLGNEIDTSIWWDFVDECLVYKLNDLKKTKFKDIKKLFKTASKLALADKR